MNWGVQVILGTVGCTGDNVCTGYTGDIVFEQAILGTVCLYMLYYAVTEQVFE